MVSDISTETDVFTCSNGLKLRIKPISRLLVQEAQSRVPMPKVPVIQIEGKSRSEENPADPEYRNAVIEALNKRGEVAMSIALATGVQILEVPSDLDSIESDEWALIVEEAGIAVPNVDSRGLNNRKVLWLKFYAIKDEQELGQIYGMCMKTTFTLEADVTKMVREFPGESSRNTD